MDDFDRGEGEWPICWELFEGVDAADEEFFGHPPLFVAALLELPAFREWDSVRRVSPEDPDEVKGGDKHMLVEYLLNLPAFRELADESRGE